MAKAAVGQRAPAFELSGTGGGRYSLADYSEKGVILAFYPGDFTPVCTKQFCSYRDDGDRIEALGLPMLGISPQDVESHERFIEQNGLKVPLLYDEDKRSPAPTARSAPAASCGARSSWSVRGGIVRYRHVALFGLRYQDVGDLERAVRAGPLTLAEPSTGEAVRARRRRSLLAGEELGEGPPVVLAHGVTATRRYVVHGSKALARAGYTQISYDARGPRRVGAGPRGPGLHLRRAGRRPRAT